MARVKWLGAVVAALVCVGVGWWAGQVATTPQSSGADERPSAYVLAEARVATVGRTLSYGVSVTQNTRAVARNALPGVVVSARPGRLNSGDVAYVVAGVPVRVVQGQVPFYRSLAPGAEGADVRQLEAALVKLGHLRSSDRTYDWRTAAAVRAWQKSLALPATGTVALGELVAVPALPAVLSLGEGITPGAVLSGGEESVLAPVGDRIFAMELSPEQARLVPNEAAVTVQFKTRAWPARIVDTQLNSESQVTRLILSAPDGGPVCGAQCSELPGGASVQLSGQVAVVPRSTGPAVPVAAVQTRADGSAFVLTEAGAPVEVTVKGAGSGLVVVSGLAAGTRVRVGHTQPDATQAPAVPAPAPTGTRGA